MLEIIQPAYQTSLQDVGRTGYQRYGVPVSGPMDWIAHLAANLLVGNPENEACLEIGLTDAGFRLHCDALIALTGAGYCLKVNGRQMPTWTSIFMHKGAEIKIEKIEGGNWAYLSLAGGIDLPSSLGSKSRYARAGLGMDLKIGDILRLKHLNEDRFRIAGRTLETDLRPAYGVNKFIHATASPHAERFTSEGSTAFWHCAYTISADSDRMGLRLKGEPVSHQNGADIISQGMVLGAVQVPADGQPIVMMPDHPTTGGYTQIAVVTRTGLPLLAQGEPGMTRFNFEMQSVEDAQRDYVEMVKAIKLDINEDKEDWTQL